MTVKTLHVTPHTPSWTPWYAEWTFGWPALVVGRLDHHRLKWNEPTRIDVDVTTDELDGSSQLEFLYNHPHWFAPYPSGLVTWAESDVFIVDAWAKWIPFVSPVVPLRIRPI